jgi:hypothetical protein
VRPDRDLLLRCSPLSAHALHGVPQTSFPLQTADRRADGARRDITGLPRARALDRRTYIAEPEGCPSVRIGTDRLKTVT